LILLSLSSFHLRYWEVEGGKQYLAAHTADAKWKTHTCTLGFPLMGIWDPYSDGTDINAVDVNMNVNVNLGLNPGSTSGLNPGSGLSSGSTTGSGLGLVATADDFGKLNLFNYPCLVKDAPKKTYGGHSSFVQNVRWLPPSTTNSTSIQRPSGRSGGRGADNGSSGITGITDMCLATVGGDDCMLVVWKVVPSASAATVRRTATHAVAKRNDAYETAI
jgi:hypothetical protein